MKGKLKMKRKHMRLPNGFGQITELKNRRLRNPFRAMITVGKTNTGRPICKLLKPKAYFKTYNDAYAALMEYHQNPYEIDQNITLEELYEKWSDSYFEKDKAETTIRGIKDTWKYMHELYKSPVQAIKTGHIKECIEHAYVQSGESIKYASSIKKQNIKSLFNMLFDYAVEFDIVDRNYSRSFHLDKNIIDESRETKIQHISFTDDEMSILWQNVGKIKYIELLLVQCYSGWRPQELGLIKLSDVDLNNWIIKGGIKTSFGKNRIVPVHEKIRGFVKSAYLQAKKLHSDYLFNYECNKNNNLEFTYPRYKKVFNYIIESLGLNPEHKPHDGRKHFITLCKRYNVDEYAIKYIVGHNITDITEKVYTDRDIKWLSDEINKIV